MSKKRQCEGWRRHGGMFTYGPVRWRQCDNKGVVMLTVKQDGKKENPMSACKTCWQECIDNEDIKVLEAIPLEENNDE